MVVMGYGLHIKLDIAICQCRDTNIVQTKWPPLQAYLISIKHSAKRFNTSIVREFEKKKMKKQN